MIVAVTYAFDFLFLLMIFAFLLTAAILIYNRFYDRFYQTHYKNLLSETVESMLDEEIPPPYATLKTRKILRNVIIDLLFITKGQSLTTLRKIYDLNGFYEHDLSLLRSLHWHKRLAAIVRLDQWKSVGNLRDFAYLLDDRNKFVRIHAMKAFSLTPDPHLARNILIHLAATKVDVSIRYECLSRLLIHHRKLVLEALKKKKLHTLGHHIIKVLGDRRDIAAVPLIIEACQDANIDLRESAYFALGKIGDPRGVSFLIQGLEALESRERLAAVLALHQLDEGIFHSHKEALLQDPDPLVRGWCHHLVRQALT